eukprot:1158165-Prymnesium_polylepis.2
MTHPIMRARSTKTSTRTLRALNTLAALTSRAAAQAAPARSINASQATKVPSTTSVLVAWKGQFVRRPVLYEPAADERGEHLAPEPCLTMAHPMRRDGTDRVELSGALKAFGPLLLRTGPCYFERARRELSNGTLGVP